jgi:hypothetical protein
LTIPAVLHILNAQKMNFGCSTKWMIRLGASFLMALAPGQAAGQAPVPPASPAASPFGITDNSFLVEEAFNQEAGIFQNIFVFSRTRQRTVCSCSLTLPVQRSWDMSFTQEWPMGGVRHQLSYTLPLSGEGGQRQLDDLLVNYRFQLMSEGAGRPAISPRLSLITPTTTGDARDHEWGLQANLPVSKRAGAVYFHGNVGATWRRIDQFVGPRSQRGLAWRTAGCGRCVRRDPLLARLRVCMGICRSPTDHAPRD